MVCDLFTAALTAMAACPQIPFAPDNETENREARQSKPSGVTDILTIGANPTLDVYLTGLFRRFCWTIHRTRSCESAIEFLWNNKAAVAICEEVLPDGCWLDVASSLKSVPNKPLLVVIGSEKALRGEVLAWGGTDALIRPLREADVIRTAASAWHRWMKRFETHHTRGPRCSGA
jgi:hypothetical protein